MSSQGVTLGYVVEAPSGRSHPIVRGKSRNPRDDTDIEMQSATLTCQQTVPQHELPGTRKALLYFKKRPFPTNNKTV